MLMSSSISSDGSRGTAAYGSSTARALKTRLTAMATPMQSGRAALGSSKPVAQPRRAALSQANGKGRGRPASALPLDAAQAALALDAAHTAISHAVASGPAVPDLALEMVVPQCARQVCGDVLYRSTLDAELRREVKELTTPGGLAIVTAVLT